MNNNQNNNNNTNNNQGNNPGSTGKGMEILQNMSKYQKSAIALAIVIIILVIIRVSVTGSNGSNMATSTSSMSSSTVSMTSNCGFTVTSVKSGEAVTFPLTVSGMIDNSKSPASACKWQMFEGQAGSAQLYYNYQNTGWKKISSVAPIMVDNWMSQKSNFTAKFAFMNKGDSLPAGTPMKIVFTEENASGMGTVDTFELPFVIK